jgi:hypothetical protein
MVITRLIGGLGNQMFQYAVGRRLAHEMGVELKLDITGFQSYKLRTYSLGNLNIQENFATLEEIKALTKPTIAGRILAKLWHRSPRPPKTYIREKHFHFDPNILKLSDNVYLEGYWQSEKYFADIAGILRQEFTIKTPQTGKNKELGEKIATCESVSLHIRRGDYACNPHTKDVHGLCGIDYYFRCVEQISQMAKKPHFFIFSDDPKLPRDSFKESYPTTFVNHNGADEDYEDLHLMSQCKHHIIANSTFSWWGAWLNGRSDKIVFAPSQWFAKEEQASRKMTDLLPANWIVL